MTRPARRPWRRPRLWLVCVAGVLTSQDGPPIVLARRAGSSAGSRRQDPAVESGEAAPVQLQDPDHVISRVHAYVSVENGIVLVRDADSMHGTYFSPPGGEQVDADRHRAQPAPARLEHADRPAGFHLRAGRARRRPASGMRVLILGAPVHRPPDCSRAAGPGRRRARRAPGANGAAELSRCAHLHAAGATWPGWPVGCGFPARRGGRHAGDDGRPRRGGRRTCPTPTCPAVQHRRVPRVRAAAGRPGRRAGAADRESPVRSGRTAARAAARPGRALRQARRGTAWTWPAGGVRPAPVADLR